MNESHNQIPLNFKNVNHSTFDEFIIESNEVIIDSLKSFSSAKAYIFYLWGDSGTGKSHLLNAFIHLQTRSNITAVMIQPKDLVNREYVSLIEAFDYVCIDDCHLISGNGVLEEALFFWINEIKQAKKKLILASQISNLDKKWQLADLRSRLSSGITYQLKALSRSGVLEALNQQTKIQGLKIDEKVINYLEKNCPMNMSFLKNLVLELDKATLIHKKQVTIPLIKKILQTGLVK